MLPSKRLTSFPSTRRYSALPSSILVIVNLTSVINCPSPVTSTTLFEKSVPPPLSRLGEALPSIKVGFSAVAVTWGASLTPVIVISPVTSSVSATGPPALSF